MGIITNQSDYNIVIEAGKKLSQILLKLFEMAKPGINLLKIEEKANDLIKKSGGEPAFKRVKDYNFATCLNINDGIVHGIPKDYVLKNGDLLSIDIGLYYKGFNTDTDYTFYIGKPGKDFTSQKKLRFLEVGKQALKKAIQTAKTGYHIGNISSVIQQIIESKSYQCALNLTGHGIGRNLHENPLIPCFLDKDISKTPILKEGMILAIEVIYMEGKPELVLDPQDRWTLSTKDGKMSGVFEETIIVTKDKPLVITKLPI